MNIENTVDDNKDEHIAGMVDDMAAVVNKYKRGVEVLERVEHSVAVNLGLVDIVEHILDWEVLLAMYVDWIQALEEEEPAFLGFLVMFDVVT